MALTGLDKPLLKEVLDECSRESVLSCVDDNIIIHSLTTAAIATISTDDAFYQALLRYSERLANINIDDPIALRTEMTHYERCFILAKENLLEDDEIVLNYSDRIAMAYLYSLGKYDQSMAIFNKVFEIRKHTLGPEHPDTLGSRNNIASLYQSTGRFEEAIEHYEISLKADP